MSALVATGADAAWAHLMDGQMRLMEGQARLTDMMARILECLLSGWAPPMEQLAGASPPTRPPVRPPTAGRSKNAVKQQRYRERKKERERGGHPTPQVVDSPRADNTCDSHPYTVQDIPSTTHVAQTTVKGSGTGVSDAPQHVTPMVTEQVTPVTKPVTQPVTPVTERGVGEREVFAVAVSSKPTTEPLLSSPLKSPPPSSPKAPGVTTVTASRAVAAHAARARAGRAGASAQRTPKSVTGNAPPVTTVTPVTGNAVTAPRDGESAVTPDWRIAPGFSLKDAMCEVFRKSTTYAYTWREKDNHALRTLLGMADEDEILMRWHFSMRATHPPCRGLDALLRRWNEFGAALPEPSAPRGAQPAPAPRLDVGRSSATECACGVHGCDGFTRTGPTYKQPLCAHHAMAMVNALGNDVSDESAAAWVLGQNAEEVPP